MDYGRNIGVWTRIYGELNINRQATGELNLSLDFSLLRIRLIFNV